MLFRSARSAQYTTLPTLRSVLSIDLTKESLSAFSTFSFASQPRCLRKSAFIEHLIAVITPIAAVRAIYQTDRCSAGQHLSAINHHWTQSANRPSGHRPLISYWSLMPPLINFYPPLVGWQSICSWIHGRQISAEMETKMQAFRSRVGSQFSRTWHKMWRTKVIDTQTDLMETQLRRCLSTFDIVLLGIGHMVGSGQS